MLYVQEVHVFVAVGRVLTIETLPLKLSRKLWAGPDHLNPDQTYFPDEYLHHVLYVTRIYFIYGTVHRELIGLLLLIGLKTPTTEKAVQYYTILERHSV